MKEIALTWTEGEFDFLSDTTEQTQTRFVCFITPSLKRFDLAITTTHHFFGKKLVTEMQSGKTIILGPDDLEREGYLEHVFQLNEEEAEELHDFLGQIVGTISFTDI